MSSGAPQQRVPRDVKVFGAASFFTDVASDMVRPLLPFFLSQVLRAGGTELGLIEGSADAASSLLKLLSGRIDDRLRGGGNEARRKWLIVLGYAVAAVARPLTALATSPLHVLATRVGDRVGKGIRTAPRDAWIADVTPLAARARAYGLHRALDNAGAFAGPLVAIALFKLAGLDLRTVIALSVVPASIAVLALVLGIRPKASTPGAPGAASGSGPAGTPAAAGGERLPAARFPPALRRFLGVATLLTLGSASQGFFLLRAGQAGFETWSVLLLWTGHSGLAALLNVPLSTLSNRLGRRRTIVLGWLTLALVHAGFAASGAPWTVVALFALYSVHFGLTEGAERTLLAELAPVEARGRAFGTFHALVGVAQLGGNLGFGLLWDRVHPTAAFATSAAVVLAATSGLVLLVPAHPPRPTP